MPTDDLTCLVAKFAACWVVFLIVLPALFTAPHVLFMPSNSLVLFEEPPPLDGTLALLLLEVETLWVGVDWLLLVKNINELLRNITCCINSLGVLGAIGQIGVRIVGTQNAYRLDFVHQVWWI